MVEPFRADQISSDWEGVMATFIYLVNLTDEGIKGIADTPHRRAAAEKMISDLGGEIKGTWLTMGMYDRVLVVDFPDGEANLRLGGASVVLDEPSRSGASTMTKQRR